METGWQHIDIRIGWLAYSKHIAPRCTRAPGDGVQKDRDVQVLLSSIREDSAAIFDWNNPLHEYECSERRPRKFTSSDNHRGGHKGPTFGTIFKDMGRE
ncbi:hypothetical protein CHU98_g9938 [Xylaria longipes]|nr:hypothetical protein CHU98_g9938 [Xylaria longipes]